MLKFDWKVYHGDFAKTRFGKVVTVARNRTATRMYNRAFASDSIFLIRIGECIRTKWRKKLLRHRYICKTRSEQRMSAYSMLGGESVENV